MAEYPKRSQFDSYEEYAQAFHEWGGPRPGQKYRFPQGMGTYCDLMNAIYGETAEELAKSDSYQAGLEQNRRPNVFVNKYDD
ncbi:hypothetical protein X769_15745 [Mesorhizobium sp. LSJC268A00]|uniref:hypothetical protein n=1 Tax=unclassified Mesorhizobium TaxID=325217 RepID=UPI0003CF822D|nr:MULTISPECIES: hypothetical protein [unclassified Mesorhizobium]ESX03922.1 hypothetical protein X769_15745 [Mesorhizobium sp. LSJC268A00]